MRIEYLTPAEVARLCRKSERALRDMRYRRTGPRPTRLGRDVVYSVVEVERWLDAATEAGEDWR